MGVVMKLTGRRRSGEITMLAGLLGLGAADMMQKAGRCSWLLGGGSDARPKSSLRLIYLPSAGSMLPFEPPLSDRFATFPCLDTIETSTPLKVATINQLTQGN